MRVSNGPVVVIFQHRLLHYRVELFEKLKTACEGVDIKLRLVHGQASKAEKVRNDEGYIDWADKVRNRYWRVGGRDILWQPTPPTCRSASMIVLMQENRIVSNYPYLFHTNGFSGKLGYWGHGLNFQSRAPNGLRERWKKSLINNVDWWFAYTNTTVEALQSAGFPAERISCLNNAVNTTEFRRLVSGVSDQEKSELRQSLGIPESAPIAVFCGSLYPDKRLELLLPSVEVARKQVPGLQIIIIGDGPSEPMLRIEASTRPWCHLVGVKKGRDKALYFSLAKIMLNPGLLGLHVLDSFAAGLPLISTLDAAHSPEVAYVENGVNGVLVENTPERYAAAICHLLGSEEGYKSVSDAALASAEHFSLDAMVRNFVGGLQSCLALEPKRR